MYTCIMVYDMCADQNRKKHSMSTKLNKMMIIMWRERMMITCNSHHRTVPAHILIMLTLGWGKKKEKRMKSSCWTHRHKGSGLGGCSSFKVVF